MPSRSNIIDHMLRTLGESGVSNDQSTHPTVQTCNSVLDDVSEEVQLRGWWFNSETDLKLVPDNRGEIILPGNTLSVRLTDVERYTQQVKERYAFRARKVYDNYEHTFNLGDPIYVDIKVQLEIDDLPAAAQNYIKHLAAERVFTDEDGDQQKLAKLERNRQMAWQTLQAESLKNQAVNALDGYTAQAMTRGWAASGSRNPNYIGGRIR